MSDLNFRGVRQKGSVWLAYIYLKSKHIHLGTFQSFGDAVTARIDAELKIFGVSSPNSFTRRLSWKEKTIIHRDHALISVSMGRGNNPRWATVDLNDIDIVKEISWRANDKGYAIHSGPGSKKIRMHRLIMSLGAYDAGLIDHIDGNRLNNRRANLRICSASENARNRCIGKNNASGAKGVFRQHNGLYRSQIMSDGISHYLGTFINLDDAADAYDAAAIRLHGEFALTNMVIRSRTESVAA